MGQFTTEDCTVARCDFCGNSVELETPSQLAARPQKNGYILKELLVDFENTLGIKHIRGPSAEFGGYPVFLACFKCYWTYRAKKSKKWWQFWK
jgi:hypothetical protein